MQMRGCKLSGHDREDPAQTQEMTALRALLAGMIDYAGLFPPAGLDMATALGNYASHRTHDDAWMLGRFVVPVARLEEFDRILQALGEEDRPEWRLSAILSADYERDIATVRAFNVAHAGRASVDSFELPLASEEEIQRVAAASADASVALFVEVAAERDPVAMFAVIKQAGIAAKVRTGGVTPDAFPPVESIARFLRRGVEAGVRIKATAGLHHPLSGEYPVTYDAGAPVGTMYGYLNVFLAAGFMKEGMCDDDAIRLLGERSASAFLITSGAIAWGDFRLSAVQLRRMRSELAVSFGSCSFREPTEELRALTIL
jgi:hypothetical protein